MCLLYGVKEDFPIPPLTPPFPYRSSRPASRRLQNLVFNCVFNLGGVEEGRRVGPLFCGLGREVTIFGFGHPPNYRCSTPRDTTPSVIKSTFF